MRLNYYDRRHANLDETNLIPHTPSHPWSFPLVRPLRLDFAAYSRCIACNYRFRTVVGRGSRNRSPYFAQISPSPS